MIASGLLLRNRERGWVAGKEPRVKQRGREKASNEKRRYNLKMLTAVGLRRKKDNETGSDNI